MSRNLLEIDAALGGLPLDDRIAALAVAIKSRRAERTPAVLGLLACALEIARDLSAAERVALAEIVRDAADEIERGHSPAESRSTARRLNG